MKKVVISIVLALIMLSISSCGPLRINPMELKAERETANSRFENLLDKLESKDFEEVKALFAESAKQTEDFDEKLSILINYYKGESYNYDDHGTGPSTSETIKSGRKRVDFIKSYDIYTTEETYRMFLVDIVRNDFDKSEVGIKSLYIIKYKNDTAQEYIYRGDGKETPGIHIAITGDN
ncbi:MAG: DUF5104 domain-containing protein [Clostridia bacterium]|nr:DUF5104 domain-containing protein [Clostridia bacterium]